jgi:hypothetical protein
MAEILSRRIDAFLAGTQTTAPSATVVDRYEYGRLAADLDRFFREVVSGSG